MPEYDRIDDVVDQFLRHLEEGTTPPSLYGLTEDEQTQAEAIFRLIRACRGSTADVPSLEDDPVAVELGLVPPPAATVRIRGGAVKAARLARRMDIDELADALAALGHQLGFAEVLDVELASGLELDRKLAKDLAAMLSVPLDQIAEARERSPPDSLSAFLRSRLFSDQVASWAKRRGYPVEQARLRFGNQLATAAARSKGEPDATEWERLLRALLKAHET